MTDPDDEFPAVGQLREQLVEAARRQAATGSAPGRRQRAVLGLVFAALAVTGAATGASLLGTGTPVRELHGKSSVYMPASRVGAGPAAILAADPGRHVHWGVAPYTGRDGSSCAVVGVVQLGRLGLVEGGVFRPYGRRVSGPCGDLGKAQFFLDVRYFPGAAPRTAVYGRTRSSFSKATLVYRRRKYQSRLGHSGTFLFLFAGKVAPGEVKVSVA